MSTSWKQSTTDRLLLQPSRGQEHDDAAVNDPIEHADEPVTPAATVARSGIGFLSSPGKLAIWVTAGFLFAFVPGMISQVVAPRWMVASSLDELLGATVYLSLLALSGLAVAVIGLRFGLIGRFTEGLATALRMHLGVFVGTLISVMVLAEGTMDLGLAAVLIAMLISIPYWVCAGLGLGLGSAVYQWRSDS